MTTPSSGDSAGYLETGSVSVETDDVVSGCVKWLASFSDVTDLLGVHDNGSPFIFQYQMHVVLEGTQKAAIVVNRNGSWSAPNVHNTLRLPRLSIEFWVDPLRDVDRNYIELGETQRRTDALFDTADKHLHRPQGGVQVWGTVRTIDCTRLGEPISYEVPNGDGLIRSQIFYGVSVG